MARWLKCIIPVLLILCLSAGCIPADMTFRDFIPQDTTESPLPASTPIGMPEPTLQPVVSPTQTPVTVLPTPEPENTPAATPEANGVEEGVPQTPPDSQEESGVVFLSAALEAGVRQYLNKADGEPISEEELSEIARIVIDAREAETAAEYGEENENTVVAQLPACAEVLSDLSLFPNLKALELYGLYRAELAPVYELELEELTLYDCGLRDCKGLENMHTLKRLCVANNVLTELDGLESLTLEELDASENRLTSMPECATLVKLNLAGNRLRSIQKKTDMQQLAWLDVSDNFLAAFDNLPLDALSELYARNNGIVSIEPIRSSSLTILDICGNPIDTLYGIRDVKDLERLYIAGTTSTGIYSLRRLEKLQYVYMDEEQITMPVCAQLTARNVTLEVKSDAPEEPEKTQTDVGEDATDGEAS